MLLQILNERDIFVSLLCPPMDGNLQDVYMIIPQRVTTTQPNKVWKLLKSLNALNRLFENV